MDARSGRWWRLQQRQARGEMRPGRLWQVKVCGSTASCTYAVEARRACLAWLAWVGCCKCRWPASSGSRSSLEPELCPGIRSLRVEASRQSWGQSRLTLLRNHPKRKMTLGAALSHHPEPGVLNYGLVGLFAAGTRRALECGLSVRYDHDMRSARDDRKDGGYVTAPWTEKREARSHNG